MGQKVAHLIHYIYAAVIVRDADVNVHPKNQQAAGQVLHVGFSEKEFFESMQGLVIAEKFKVENVDKVKQGLKVFFKQEESK